MAKIYYDKDAGLNLLKDKTVAIICYGIQGRGQSLCLRDSGIRVVVSEMEGTPNFQQAQQDGFTPVSAAEAAKSADIIQILTQFLSWMQLENGRIINFFLKIKKLI